jgi:O-antigen/teichoic acid export membrane protein
MVYMDRFLISGVLGLAAVAYYVTPFEIVTKLLIIPGALVGVLFPMFSAGLATDRLQTAQLFRRSVNWLFLCMFPIVLLITVFAADGLRLWLSDEFAQRGAAVLQWLATGVLINSLAYVPFAFVQGAGRPDLSAKLHLAELPVYLLVLWLFMQQWGIVGAAAAWTLRVAVDAVVLFAMSASLEGELGGTLKKDGMIFAAALIVLALGCWPGAILSKIVFSAVVLLCFVWFAWRHLLSADERATVNSRLPHYLQG